MSEKLVEVQYNCEYCGNFVVYHRNDDRNTHCCWCDGLVYETGLLSKIEEDKIVTYQDGNKISERRNISQGGEKVNTRLEKAADDRHEKTTP